MKQIPLSRGLFALVDDADFDWLNQWKWFTHSQGYAVKNQNNTQVLMHREIMKPPKGFIVDHVNSNRLDCRRENMRICTYSDNNKNARVRPKRKNSKYKGVALRSDCKYRPWRAEIHAPIGRLYIGSFTKEEDAALAYNFAALEHFGEFASYNRTEP